MMRVTVFCIAALLPAASIRAQDKVYTDAEGLIRIEPFPVAEEYANPAWHDSLETPFWRRANRAIEHLKDESCGNTYFENEKRSYPNAMAKFLAGDRGTALGCLQGGDANAGDWNAHTLGIDYFPCFTLKGQMRKFFWFGDFGGYLRSSYLDTMRQAADLWTETDPATTPHPLYGTGNEEYGYTPVQRGYRVDRRYTDNLRAMRETSVYLMAEETGNEETRLLYKDSIKTYVRKLYTIGMGEWDSENYMGHTLAPYLSLYDFAVDPDVKMLAKAACDWICAAGALKYWRGGYGGPCARDYGGSSVVFGAQLSHVMNLYFGEATQEDPEPHYDDVHAIMSSYRPPLAVVALARKQFSRPVEMLNSKPYYRNWEEGKDSEPQYHETLFFGRSYYMGSVVSADSGWRYDIGPFKLLAYNTTRGIDFVTPFTGDAAGKFNEKKGGDEIAQYRNLLIWLRGDNRLPFGFMVPQTAGVETASGVLFFELEKTWIAVRPIRLGSYAEISTDLASKYPDEIVLQAQPDADPVCGFAMEVGEAPDHAGYDAFKQAVLNEGGLDLSNLAAGTVVLTGTDGSTLGATYNRDNDIPTVVRNGQTVNWGDHYAVYDPVGGDEPVSLGWMDGTLTVKAGGYEFVQTVNADGEVTSGAVPSPGSVRLTRGSAVPARTRLAGRVLTFEGAPGAAGSLAVVRPDGSTVLHRRFRGAVHVPLRRLAAGAYLVRVRTGAGRRVERIVIGSR